VIPEPGIHYFMIRNRDNSREMDTMPPAQEAPARAPETRPGANGKA